MSARTYLLKQEREEITQLLQGEQLLVLTDFEVAPGKVRVEKPPDPPDNRSGLRKAGETAAGVGGLLVVGPDTPSLNKMLGVVSATGHAGSWASRFLVTYPGVKGRTCYLAVTDRRLLLISKKIWGKDPDYAVDLAIPRNDVRTATRKGRPLARGRVVIEFLDGSMVALKLGSVLAGQANHLVKALTIPGATPPAP